METPIKKINRLYSTLVLIAFFIIGFSFLGYVCDRAPRVLVAAAAVASLRRRLVSTRATFHRTPPPDALSLH